MVTVGRVPVRGGGFFVALTITATAAAQADFRCANPEAIAAKRSQAILEAETVTGRLHAVAVFGRFADEEARNRDATPGFAADLFDAETPGSVTHFYEEMSRGQFALSGSSLPVEYAASGPGSSYTSPLDGERGAFGDFVREVLQAADEDIDFGLFDNDGPDGLPNSGDDDGLVDFTFVIARSTPPRFIISQATGVASLGLNSDVRTNDARNGGGQIRIRDGVLQQGQSFAEAVGSMSHEFGHQLGLPDLFDTDVNELGGAIDPNDDSAGIGYWGLMAHGARGWGDSGGPNPFCSWSLAQLGWLGVANAQLRIAQEDLPGVVFTDVNAGGEVHLIWLSPQSYLLVEYRSRGRSFYERNLPEQGLLVWEVDETASGNDDERAPLVDLVCADGLYRDAGFPLGEVKDYDFGSDNLDFWAHDIEHAARVGGNLGDATDVFDGVTFSDFSVVSNPSAPTRVSISRIRRDGEVMVADIRLNDRRRAGPITVADDWVDTIEIVGDINVFPGADLRVFSGTTVLVGSDQRQSGLDPERCELNINGRLRNFGGTGVNGRPTRFTSAKADPAPGDWQGMVLTTFGSLRLSDVVIEYGVHGITGRNLQQIHTLDRVQISNTSDDAINLHTTAGSQQLENVTIRNAGADGIEVHGPGDLVIKDSRIEGSAGRGVVRTDGPIQCLQSQLVDNGVGIDGAANLVLGRGAWGAVADNQFRGGIGLLGDESADVSITGNRFEEHVIGLISASAALRIVDNTFSGNQLAFQISGVRLPGRLELNTVLGDGQLISNQSTQQLLADNNWWGRDDESWIAERMDGAVTWRPFLNFDPSVPLAFDLQQNFPNPFNASTVINYAVSILHASLSDESQMSLEIRTIHGGLVRRLVKTPAAPGIYTAVWDGMDESGHPAASGVYYYQLRVGALILIEKMAIVR